MKFNDTLMTLIDADIQNGLIPMLLGEPGIGKSSWVEALGQRNCTQVFVLPCNQLADKADLTGGRLVPIEGTDEYKMVFYPHAVIMDAIKYAEEHPREFPILFMDELNRTTPDVTSEALSIPTLRSIGNKKLPKNLRVITAGNDKGNITSLDEASISRFVLYHVAPDVDTFLGLDPNLNPFVKQVLLDHPDTIFCKKIKVVTGQAQNNGQDDEDDEVDIDSIIDDAEEMNQIATPRTISGVSRWLNSFSNAQLVDLLTDTRQIDGVEVSALQEALEGHTGKTSFTAFLLAEIAGKVSTVNNQGNAMTVTKPQCYDRMKQCATLQDLNTLIGTMSDQEKSACLVYALYERADNARYLQVLGPATQNVLSADMKVLMNLYANDMLDEGNKDALMRTNCSISNTLSIILNT